MSKHAWQPLGVFFAALLGLFQGGCSLSGTREVVEYYTLDEPVDTAPEAALADPRRLAMETFSAPSHLDQLQMIRRTDAASPAFQLYPELHRWGQVPREMATELAVRHLGRRFGGVESYPSLEPVALVLSLRLARFEELRAPGAAVGVARVRLEGRVLLLDAAGATIREVALAADGERPTTHPGGEATDHAGLARALRAALTAALDELVGRLPPP